MQYQRKLTVLLFFLIGVFSFSDANAQKKSELVVNKDSLISVLQSIRAGDYKPQNSVSKDSESSIIDRGTKEKISTVGFRVQIYLGPSRSEAYAEQSRFKRLFKNLEAYVSYNEPNYRVKVGDFTTRAEAQKLAEGLKAQFSNVFVFTETIYIYE